MISQTPMLRIAVTGPESTGKSTIAAQLAEYYGTSWVEEQARSYIDKLDRSYRKSDLVKIAHLQIEEQRRQSSNAKRLLFCDTEMLVIKIWYEHFYGKLDLALKKAWEQQHFDLYLLMDIDLPWEYDLQREHPEKREYFFNLFKEELEKRKTTALKRVDEKEKDDEQSVEPG